MPFTLYFRNESFNPGNAESREGAINAAVHAINEQRETLNGEFGIHDWAAVVL
jgi:hypothetical protein